MAKPVAVDLFAGCGGLSLGLRNAGFRVAAAVECYEPAARTYAANFRRTALLRADVRDVSGADILHTAGTRKLDLLAACPPCQGFTSLTSKHPRIDPRNELVAEVVRLADELRPRTVMFENVPRLVESKKGKVYFERLVGELEDLGYRISWFVADAADFGTPQRRRRLIVFAGKKEIDPPAATHGPATDTAWNTVREAIGAERSPATFRGDIAECAGLADWHVVRNLGPANKARLAAAKPGGSRADLPNELRPNCHKNSSNGFRNVYGRMIWDAPSPTITGGCTSPSKGRFGHPSRQGTISVKEAAILQDFPPTFKLATPFIDQACQLIGNAFPARLASAAARRVIETL